MRVARKNSAVAAANECGVHGELGQLRRQIMSIKRIHIDAPEFYERYAVYMNQFSGIHRISLSLENEKL